MSFWRGGFVLHFDFSSTPFHSGRLIFAVHMGQFTIPTTLDKTSDQYLTWFDLSAQNKTFTVQLPFLDTIDYRRICNGPDTDMKTLACGTWSLRVANALKATGTVANNVDYFTLMCGAPNYEAWGLYGNNKTLLTLEGQMSEVATQPTMPIQETKIPDVTLQTKVATRTLFHFGEKYKNWRDLVRRFTPMCTTDGTFDWQASETVGTETDGVNYPVLHGIYEVKQALHSGLMARYASCYAFWRGSLRFEIVSNYTYYDIDNKLNRDSAVRTVVMFDRSDRWMRSNNTGSGIGFPVAAMTLAQYFSPVSNPIVYSANWTRSWGSSSYLVGNVYPRYDFANVSEIPSYAICHSAMPLDIAERGTSSHSVEIPFCTEYPVLRYEDLGNPMTDAALYNPGVLLVATLGDTKIETTNNTPGTNLDVRGSNTILAAAGDDWRAGVYLGHHPVTPVGLTNDGVKYWPLYPDKYT